MTPGQNKTRLSGAETVHAEFVSYFENQRKRRTLTKALPYEGCQTFLRNQMCNNLSDSFVLRNDQYCIIYFPGSSWISNNYRKTQNTMVPRQNLYTVTVDYSSPMEHDVACCFGKMINDVGYTHHPETDCYNNTTSPTVILLIHSRLPTIYNFSRLLYNNIGQK